jgi:DNA repair protein RecO
LSDEHQSEALVLRQRPYSESSLIVALLSKDAGVVHLMVRGGARRAKAGLDVIDLFRLVQASWRPSRTSDLHTARAIVVTDSFEAIAKHPNLFAVMGWLSRHILAHCESGGAHPDLYAAMIGMLTRIRDGSPPPPAAVWTAIMVTLAYEEGILPFYSDDHDLRFQQIIHAARNPSSPFPQYDAKTWNGLRDWGASLFAQAGQPLPDRWQKF